MNTESENKLSFAEKKRVSLLDRLDSVRGSLLYLPNEVEGDEREAVELASRLIEQALETLNRVWPETKTHRHEIAARAAAEMSDDDD
jgi:hypothetical protein